MADTTPHEGTFYVVQSLSGDRVWEDHVTYPGASDRQLERATEMAEGMDEDYRGPWRVVRRVVVDTQVVAFDSRALPSSKEPSRG